MSGWPRPGISGAARSARTTAAAGNRIACARSRITPAMARGICGRARWPAAAPRAGSSRLMRWTRCAPSWPTITASRRSVNRSWRSTRRSARPAHRTRRRRRPRPRRRGTKGLHDQIAAEIAAEVERLAALAVDALGRGCGTGRGGVGHPHRDDQPGAVLLGQLLAADPGHRGPRIDCRPGIPRSSSVTTERRYRVGACNAAP